MIDLAVLIVIGLVSGAGGVGVILGLVAATKLRSYPGSDPLPPDGKRWSRERHIHRFDTMLSDGIWRCGICGKPRKGS